MSCRFASVWICILDGGHFSFPDVDVDPGTIGLALRWLHINAKLNLMKAFIFLATSWIYQTNFQKSFSHFVVGLWFLYSQLLIFLPPHYIFFVFSLFIGSSLLYVYLEASSLDVGFFFGLHYSTSKPEASTADSSLISNYCTSKQATQTSMMMYKQTLHTWSKIR